VVGFELDCRAASGDGVVEMALVFQCVAEVGIAFGKVRLELNRGAIGGDGLIELALIF